MELDSHFRELYLSILMARLQEQPNPLTPSLVLQLSGQTLDDAVARINSERGSIVEEIATNPAYSHGVYGAFGGYSRTGHHLEKTQGPNERAVSLNIDEGDKRELFPLPYSGYEDFKARLLGRPDDAGYVYKLIIPDHKGDNRRFSHTDYILVVPHNKIQVRASIEQDPSILIDVFKRVFPSFDRSEGTLALDPNHTPLYKR